MISALGFEYYFFWSMFWVGAIVCICGALFGVSAVVIDIMNRAVANAGLVKDFIQGYRMLMNLREGGAPKRPVKAPLCNSCPKREDDRHQFFLDKVNKVGDLNEPAELAGPSRLGQALLMIFVKHNINMYHAAEAIGVTSVQMSSIINGKKLPSDKFIESLKSWKVLDYDDQQLLLPMLERIDF